MPRATSKRKPRKAPAAPIVSGLDATPERLAKGDSDIVIALIDKAGERPGKARQFRASHLDRLHKSGALSYAQFLAGDWYRTQHAMARFGGSIISSYEGRTSRSEPGYGLPSTERQLRARNQLAAARRVIPREMIGFIDRLLLHDELPSRRNRSGQRTIREISDALNVLADLISTPATLRRYMPSGMSEA
jgi:hypothetical protein